MPSTLWDGVLLLQPAGGRLPDRTDIIETRRSLRKVSRFDPDRAQGKLFHGPILERSLFSMALDILRPVAKKNGLTESDCALRWMAHHSELKKDLGDGIIVGASSTRHLEENLQALDQGPLPQEVVDALDAGWAKIRGMPLKYWH